jgi:hypothetical protein
MKGRASEVFGECDGTRCSKEVEARWGLFDEWQQRQGLY